MNAVGSAVHMENQNWTSTAVEIVGLRSVGVDNFLGRIT